ncbi:DUF1285 domain-containing protein [Bowmanella dokdonensis]|uniref:DUF1285 domain-containing protein n=1 Tax=Bowmanella dokdonensis TaxID=751969 RepID=A0A939IR75_9ALTE|nr:DUF1285 domain-containing protein [Bowmanella dokdonensis]MBN7825824.1 DUF1285 domain-containing protein [Bowmanella dokdonensis]
MDLSRLERQLKEHNSAIAPVEQWDPPFCGDLDMQIRHDGSWHYMGTPIGRQALVRLFASVLKREGENYYLVTPVEKVGIQVEDVPLIVTNWREEQGVLVFTTNTGHSFVVGEEHPVTLMSDRVTADLLPYANAWRNLYARLHQNVFYQLVGRGRETQLEGHRQLVIDSGDYSFSLGIL